MVRTAAAFAHSAAGTEGKGNAVSDEDAEGVELRVVLPHKNPRAQRGLSEIPSVAPVVAAVGTVTLGVLRRVASGADVPVATVVVDASILAVPAPTDGILLGGVGGLCSGGNSDVAEVL